MCCLGKSASRNPFNNIDGFAGVTSGEGANEAEFISVEMEIHNARPHMCVFQPSLHDSAQKFLEPVVNQMVQRQLIEFFFPLVFPVSQWVACLSKRM